MQKTGKLAAEIIVPEGLAKMYISMFPWEPSQGMKSAGRLKAEILEDGQEIIWLKGGRGGLGNARFATPTNQAPGTCPAR